MSRPHRRRWRSRPREPRVLNNGRKIHVEDRANQPDLLKAHRQIATTDSPEAVGTNANLRCQESVALIGAPRPIAQREHSAVLQARRKNAPLVALNIAGLSRCRGAPRQPLVAAKVCGDLREVSRTENVIWRAGHSPILLHSLQPSALIADR